MATVITEASLGLDQRADHPDSEADYDQLPSTPALEGTDDAPIVIDDEDEDDEDEEDEAEGDDQEENEDDEENEDEYEEQTQGEEGQAAGEANEDEQGEYDGDVLLATNDGQQNGYQNEGEEDFELLDDGAQELLNDYEQKHAAMTAGTDSTDELLLDGEDHGDAPTDELPTVLIEFEGSLFDLFAQQASDGSGNSDVNAIPLKAPPEILDQPLSTLFSTVRIPDALGEFLEKETHLLLRSPEVDLEIIETDPTAQQVLLQDFLDVHPSNANGDAVQLVFSQRQPFLSKFKALGGVFNTAPIPSLSPTTAVSSWMSRTNAGVKRARRGDEEDELDEESGEADGVLGEHHEPEDEEVGQDAEWEAEEGDGEVHQHPEDGDEEDGEDGEDQEEPIPIGDEEYEQEDTGAEDELGAEEEDGLEEQIIDLENEDDALARGGGDAAEIHSEVVPNGEDLIGEHENGSSRASPNGLSESKDQPESAPTTATSNLSNKRSFEETDGAEDAAGDEEGSKRVKV